jgi:shikimate kinase
LAAASASLRVGVGRPFLSGASDDPAAALAGGAALSDLVRRNNVEPSAQGLDAAGLVAAPAYRCRVRRPALAAYARLMPVSQP